MVITIHGTGIDMTDPIKAYATEKCESLIKYFDNIQKAQIDVGTRGNHHQKGKVYYAEVNLHVPGKVLRVVKDAEDLYKAIDKVKDHLKVELERMKGKMRERDKKTLRGNKEYQQ
ncbi:MAG TPA: ribosome-associated translation inhibitor RaiA [Candidatus Magasanikbacteria bacterium]|nr:MAG: ribosomal subunit interface protein [Candidatus Magasanikbacteria bacterium RIFCSPLOWO2_02_FULL_47_16]OGH80047.1 MAG: ribosomal subunit interface protein [Candidatus Magasanikbacteria bacterium RIFCSPHIGHO2_02_FULL_48_18]OGH81845.1 MAG: ribosomal subunit interface protein [Candidatus Magasanikbacteria bacterium RIFCSPLOWO2_12_FULL_47_9b]HAZ28472.1 ribosome-associated translation inhibitor RaiA [Candidatus Magasanikbacteria bacterium]